MGILIGAAVMAVAALLLYTATRKGGGDSEYGQRRIGQGIKRLEENKRRYAVMTAALLAETQDALLVEAVLSNLWAKMAADLSDMWAVASADTRGRRYVTALYAVTGTVSSEGFGALRKGPDAPFIPLCIEALQALDMADCARILREATEMAADAETANTFSVPYLECFDALGGKERMVRFIRENAQEFIDGV